MDIEDKDFKHMIEELIIYQWVNHNILEILEIK